MEIEEQKFIEGFNGGYLIAKHEPDLANNFLNKIEPVSEYTQGLISGKDEWLKEKELSQLEELNNLRNSSRELGNDLERGVGE